MQGAGGVGFSAPPTTAPAGADRAGSEDVEHVECRQGVQDVHKGESDVCASVDLTVSCYCLFAQGQACVSERECVQLLLCASVCECVRTCVLGYQMPADICFLLL